jgi:hypothetical protein
MPGSRAVKHESSQRGCCGHRIRAVSNEMASNEILYPDESADITDGTQQVSLCVSPPWKACAANRMRPERTASGVPPTQRSGHHASALRPTEAALRPASVRSHGGRSIEKQALHWPSASNTASRGFSGLSDRRQGLTPCTMGWGGQKTARTGVRHFLVCHHTIACAGCALVYLHLDGAGFEFRTHKHGTGLS